MTAPQYKMDDMFKAMSNDVLARMLNNIFAQYQTYIQFTDLGDGDSQSKCKADTHGPQKSKYCADGGVYYVQSIQKGIRGPQADMPYAYSHLEENGIIPFVSIRICLALISSCKSANHVLNNVPNSGWPQHQQKCIGSTE